MTKESQAQQLSGMEKAALLLITLGAKAASSVLQHLDPAEVQSLCSQIAKQQKVDPKVLEQVVSEFAQSHRQNVVSGGMDYARDILQQALGENKAKEVLDEIASGSSGRPFDWLKSSASARLANCLRNERRQTTALVLANLSAGQAAEVMSQLPEETQGDVAYRLTAMRPVDREILRAIDESLRDKLARDGTGDFRKVGGVESLATILNNTDRATEAKILEYLQSAESTIAESVRDMLFAFEDIVTLEDRMIQVILRDLDQEDIRLSLKGASPEISEAFFRNMSERAAETLKEDLELLGPVKVRDVEAARRRILSVVHRLDEAGEISLRSDEEAVIT